MRHKYPYRYLLVLVLISMLAFSACNYPGLSPSRETPAAATWTAIAQTISAQLTLSAGTIVPGTGAGTPTADPSTVLVTPTPGGQAETPAPTATLNPSPAAPTSTLPADDPRQRLGEPAWLDTFEDSTNWPIYTDEHVSMTITNGVLRMTSLEAEVWNSWMLSIPVVEDFYLEAVMTPQTTCSAGDHYGILARAPSATEAYLFGVSCDGRYSLRLWNGQSFQALIPWTNSELVRTGTGETNRLGFLAQGERIQLYLNGNLLNEVSDTTYERGAFGPFIGSMDTPDFTVEVTEIGYWDLP